jgi:hypothetical protein
VVSITGRAWTRDASGAVSIVPERMSLVQVVLGSEKDCPSQPEVENGVPLRFLYPTE